MWQPCGRGASGLKYYGVLSTRSLRPAGDPLHHTLSLRCEFHCLPLAPYCNSIFVCSDQKAVVRLTFLHDPTTDPVCAVQNMDNFRWAAQVRDRGNRPAPFLQEEGRYYLLAKYTSKLGRSVNDVFVSLHAASQDLPGPQKSWLSLTIGGSCTWSFVCISAYFFFDRR